MRPYRLSGFRFLHIVLAVVSPWMTIDHLKAAETVELEQMLSVMESHEARVQTLRFTCVHTTGKPNAARDNFQFADIDFGRMSSQVSVDVERMRYFVTIHTAQRAETYDSSGNATHGKSFNEQAASNDGDTWRHWLRPDLKDDSATVKDEDNWSKGMTSDGVICARDEEPLRSNFNKGRMIEEYGTRIGLGFVTPFICTPGDSPIRLSTFIRDRANNSAFFIECLTQENETWQIWVGTPQTAKNSAGYLFVYDPVAGRLLTQEIGPRDLVGRTDRLPFWRVTLQYATDGDVIPQKVFFVEYGEGGGAAQWDYEEASLNPKIADSTYKLVFPEGIEVTDYVNKQMYVVGNGLKNDKEAIKKFKRRLEQRRSPNPPAPANPVPRR